MTSTRLSASFAPEGAAIELEGGETGVGFIEIGRTTTILGKTLSGYATGGILSAAKEGGFAYLIDHLTGAGASRVFSGASKAARKVGATAVAGLIDKAKEALLGEEAACSE